MMKKVGNIIRWIIGIFIILIGLIFSLISVTIGILWALVGLIILPPISRKIPQFKGRKPVLIVGCIVFIIAGGMAMPESESPTQHSQSAQIQNTPNTPPEDTSSQDVSPQDTSTPEPANTEADTLDAKTVEEIKKWINNSVSVNTGNVSASKSDIKKWSKISEQNFLPVWKNSVLVHLQSLKQYSSMASYLKGATSLYESLYGDSTETAAIKQLADNLSESDTANKELLKKYPFDLLSEYPSHGTFYITQRLETSYSDNILGALQKEFDSYQAKSTSDWVAYDVEYSFGTALRGDTYRIIHADSLNPFTQSGAYEVYYVDTGATTETVDMQGFRNTVPVYQLIENPDELNVDLEEYQRNWAHCLTYLEELKYALDAEEYANLQADTEKIPDDISGAYYFDAGNSDADIYIQIEPGPLDTFSSGYFSYLMEGSYEYGGTMLAEIAPNIYCFLTDEDIYVFGFSKHDQEFIADIYFNGEHQGTATTRS